MTAKEKLLLQQQEEQNEIRMYKNTIDCSNFLIQRMGLDYDRAGFINRFDDETNTMSEFIFDGKKCKALAFPIIKGTELALDPYNNVKLCCGILQYYITDYLGRDTTTIFLSNKSMNENGTLTVIFDDGSSVTGNPYNKDTLKYVDMILILDGALFMDFKVLKEMDI